MRIEQGRRGTEERQNEEETKNRRQRRKMAREMKGNMMSKRRTEIEETERD
jgi:hypothetical protein